MGDTDLKKQEQDWDGNEVQQQQQKLVNLENRVARVEKLLRILDSELNNKIRWIIKTAGIGESQNSVDEDDEEDEEFQPRPKPLPLPRILQRQLTPAPTRKPTLTVTYQPQPRQLQPPTASPRFIVPAVQYDDDEEDDEEDDDQQQQQNYIDTAGKGMEMDMDENGHGEDDAPGADEGDEDYDDEGLDPLALQVELIEPEDNDDDEKNEDANGNHDKSEAEVEDAGNNPWRFGGNGQDQDDHDQDDDADADMDEQEALTLPIPAHFMDVSQLRSSDTSMTRSPQPGSILKAHIRRPTSSNFRIIQGRAKPNILSRRLIVPKNRYLMSSSLVSRLQEQNTILTASGTELKYVPNKGRSKSDTGLASKTASDGGKEKVYFCDRCPLTFTLSTRHAHLQLHKQMDLAKQQAGSKVILSPKKGRNKNKGKSSPKSLLKPISSLSPARKPRIRPRKICPICTKSYSRNQYLRNHMEEHVGEFPFLCKECFIVHNSEKELEDHCQDSDRCFISMYQP